MELQVSNKLSTNLFEAITGVLNIAPVKISGQYKIVVDKSLKLWLDDYTGRRVAIDKSVPFLQQVANFLQVDSIVSDTSVFRYGGFQRSNVKSYHIPFYFGKTVDDSFPRYFCLARVPNETINHESVDIDGNVVGPDSDIYQMKFPFKYGDIISVIDLKKIGLYNIFDEINSEKYFEYPLYFNWEDNNIKMFGYGINEGYPVINTLDILNSMSNQPYLDVLNNKILNTYVEKKIFYPRFLNIEFEFEYTNEYTHFNNFMGYLSARESYGQGNKISCYDRYLYVKIQEGERIIDEKVYGDQIAVDFKWKQIDYFNNYTLDKYLNLIADGTINEIHERNPQFRFKTYRVQVGDYISILHPTTEELFEYQVTESDIIESSLMETWIKICYNCTKLSGRNYIFTPKQEGKFVVVTIVNQLGDKLDEECTITIPSYYQTLDRFESTDTNYNQFRGVTEYDIWLCGQPNLMDNVNTICIPNDELGYNNRFNIVDKFKINDATVLRLDRIPGIKQLSRAYIFEDLYEEVVKLEPINFFTTFSDLTSEKPFDFETYRKNLYDRYITNYVPKPDASEEDEKKRQQAFIEAYESFVKNNQEPLYQYVEEDVSNTLTDKPTLSVDYVNEEIIKNLLFCSMGCTTYMIPNLLNIDKQCWTQNGCVDPNQGRNDYIRYNWFLINGECPEYLLNDVRQLRYMNRIMLLDDEQLPTYIIRPKITSRLIRVSDTICETVFLGVKYQLPVQYENYKFCTYLNFNNQKDTDLHYNFEIYPEENLLMLSINKYLDFNDLLRGGDDKNEPLIDLSFFYNITNSSNQSSDYLFAFKTCGIKLEPFYNSETFNPLFNGKPQKDWRVNFNGNDYICIQREISASAGDANSFKLLFPNSGNAEFYVYSKVTYNGIEYTYISMTIQLIDIRDLEDDYLWCQDIRVKFFDTKQRFLRRVDPTADLEKEYRNPDIEQILAIDEKNIITYEPLNEDTTWGANHQIATIIVDTQYEKFELLLPDRQISLKQEYFEIHQRITENPDGSKNYFKTVFKFPEFALKDLYTDAAIIERFDEGLVNDFVPDSDYDKSTYSQMMTLFDRNQIWRILQDVLSVDLKFKYLTEDQIKLLIDDFTVEKLIDVSDYQSIQIINRSYNEWDNIQFVDQYIKLSVIDIDRNLVIWPVENEKKVNLINRHRTAYIPFLQICEDYYDFQIKEFKKYGTVWNIYDEQFGGLMQDGSKISATGLWKEVTGNIISSLFCKSNNIRLTISFAVNVDYRELLIQSIRYQDCIITNDNEKYISSLNKNLQKYIIESYADLLLTNFYNLECVENELGMRLKYTRDSKKPTLLHFEDKDKYNSNNVNFKNLIFVLTRK